MKKIVFLGNQVSEKLSHQSEAQTQNIVSNRLSQV